MMMTNDGSDDDDDIVMMIILPILMIVVMMIDATMTITIGTMMTIVDDNVQGPAMILLL